MRLERLIKPGPTQSVRLGPTVLSYVELDRMSARVAALLLARGVLPGERVAVMLARVMELPGVYYGVLRAGAVVVPVEVSASADEVATRLTETGARVVFAWHESLDAAEAGARRAGADYVVVHPASFHVLLEDVALGRDLVERGPDDLAVLLHSTNGGGVVELTYADLAGRVMPLTTEEEMDAQGH
jgi:long-chain acyl-CoA synthetase